MPTTSETKTLFIDIETAKAPDYKLFEPEKLFKHKPFDKSSVKRLKKDTEEEYERKVRSAEAEYLEGIYKKQIDWVDKCALSPLTGQVLMVGYCDEDGMSCISTKNESGEKTLLMLICDTIFQADLIIGHYIKSFDLPFIINRCRKHGIPRPTVGYMSKGRWYWNENVIDLADLWTFGKYGEYISLNNMAKYFGLKPKDETIGENFEQVFNEDIERAIAYCKYDVELTKQIYERLK